MLIIGDVARIGIDKINDIPTIEFVCTTDQRDYLLKALELDEKKQCLYKNKIITILKTNNKKIILHNADEFPPLKYLLKRTFSNNFKIKVCNPVLQTAIDYNKLWFTHSKISSWEKCIEYYSIMSCTFLKYLDRSLIYNLDSFSKTLSGWVISDTVSHIAKPYDFPKYDFNVTTLCDIYKEYTKKSIYLQLFDDINNPSDYDIDMMKWDRLEHRDKIEALIELMKIRTVHDILYDHYFVNNELPSDINKCIIHTFMNVTACPKIHIKIRSYAIENYWEIIYGINLKEYKDTTLNCLKYGVFNGTFDN